MRILISVLSMIISSYALASPYGDADVLFGCFFNNQKVPKEVAVLRSGNIVTYLYGKQDPDGEGSIIPEITIRKSVHELTQTWHNHRAEGASLYELNIPNGRYMYSIGYLNKDGKISGDIGIYKDGVYLSTLTCTDVWENNLGNRDMMNGIPEEND